MKELLVPLVAKRDPSAIEMARVWIAEKGLHCALNVGIYADHPSVDEEKAWGIMLADMLRHVSCALEDGSADSYDNIKGRILAHLNAELSAPTSEVHGRFAIDK